MVLMHSSISSSSQPTAAAPMRAAPGDLPSSMWATMLARHIRVRSFATGNRQIRVAIGVSSRTEESSSPGSVGNRCRHASLPGVLRPACSRRQAERRKEIRRRRRASPVTVAADWLGLTSGAANCGRASAAHLRHGARYADDGSRPVRSSGRLRRLGRDPRRLRQPPQATKPAGRGARRAAG